MNRRTPRKHRPLPSATAAVLLRVILGFLILGGVSGCGPGREEPFLPVDYSDWKRTTDIELDYPIPGHENRYRRIFINNVGEGLTIRQGELGAVHAYPEGTVILKEVFSTLRPGADERPVQLTAMIKRPEDSRSRGGWIWVVLNTESGEQTVFANELCVTCHANANEGHPYGDRNEENEFRDFVFFPYSSSGR